MAAIPRGISLRRERRSSESAPNGHEYEIAVGNEHRDSGMRRQISMGMRRVILFASAISIADCGDKVVAALFRN
jgi:hypothetical protein